MKEKRNFATHPRTLREALTIILERARKNKICEGHFAIDGRTDPIFGLFTVRQRNDIKRQMDTGSEETIDTLVSLIGKQNLMAMTGMTRQQAGVMIDFSDCNINIDPKVFTDRLESILTKGTGLINGARFKLEAA